MLFQSLFQVISIACKTTKVEKREEKKIQFQLFSFFPNGCVFSGLFSASTFRFIPTELLQYKLIRSVFKWIDITLHL